MAIQNLTLKIDGLQLQAEGLDDLNAVRILEGIAHLLRRCAEQGDMMKMLDDAVEASADDLEKLGAKVTRREEVKQ